jgi:hypothetical protein
MTEEDLINLGFQKVDVPDSESQNGYDYYYYKLQLMDDLVLVSSDSDTVRKNTWEVKNFDWLGARIRDRQSVEMLKQLTGKWLR